MNKNIFDILNVNNKLLNNNTKNNLDNLDKPNLVDPGVKYFFKNILNSCNQYKKSNNNILYNIFLFIVFIVILGTILIVKYKGNKSKEEIYNESIKNKEYIMSKLVQYNKQNLENQQRISNNMITNLPDYNIHPETAVTPMASLLHKKIYF